MTLADLFKKHGSQKCTGETAHYGELYERYIAPANIETMLEMGIAAGGSLLAWREWVGPHALIYGTDKKKTAAWDTQAIADNPFTQLCVLDQGNSQEMRAALGHVRFDLIIDDAGHHMLPQQIAFRSLWPLLKPGGWYVLEDLHSSYWPVKGGGYRRMGTTMERLKELCDYPTSWAYLKNKRAEHLREKRPGTVLETTVGELHFHPSIAFIRKRAT